MASDSILIVIAGGTGAFAGAAIGQLVQIGRDVVASRREDRRRREDVRLPVYSEAVARLMPALNMLQSAKIDLLMQEHNSAARRKMEEADPSRRDPWLVMEDFHADTLGPVVNELNRVGSDEVIEATIRLSRNSTFWRGMRDADHRVPINADDVVLAVAQGSVSWETRSRTPEQRIADQQAALSFYEKQLTDVIHLLRRESGLSRSSAHYYLMRDGDTREGLAAKARRRLDWRIRVWRTRRRAARRLEMPPTT